MRRLRLAAQWGYHVFGRVGCWWGLRGVSTVTVPDVDCPRDQQAAARGLHLAWVGIPLMVLVLVVDHGISIVDEIKQCTKAFLERNNVALATAYHGVHGVGLVASVGLGVVAAVHSCIKHLKVQPGRPRVSRLKRPKQQLDLAPASAGGMLPAAGTSTMGQLKEEGTKSDWSLVMSDAVTWITVRCRSMGRAIIWSLKSLVTRWTPLHGGYCFQYQPGWQAPSDQLHIRKARACSIANVLTTCSRNLRTEYCMPVPWAQHSPGKAQIGYPLSLVYLILRPATLCMKLLVTRRLLHAYLLPSFGPKRPPVRRYHPFAVQQSLDLVFTGPVRDGMPFAVLSSVTHYNSLLPSKDNSYCPPVLRYW
ncbi:hypothetical protein VOLCADRAFT_107272 [Volvox carteri f. nagariensis]|uniref:Uncharacterized protein n=1 Tax=Volvox carteri f. nagariensis TaxID=3068 RepID=D8UCX3_VOLCA|nr:uncharacterized protein VOLCADRAFT_107272 [Volvox carteri f. nagariensis]EFJ42465.1 hypothetical protein VOLCADRAFT_107272 [Volvox carteri f. nagariensis]|eukprot:XP_002956528.1 hypothetical protein VOLCADRAFT_107272 [Volvox carteri f. nagariensis]